MQVSSISSVLASLLCLWLQSVLKPVLAEKNVHVGNDFSKVFLIIWRLHSEDGIIVQPAKLAEMIYGIVFI